MTLRAALLLLPLVAAFGLAGCTSGTDEKDAADGAAPASASATVGSVAMPAAGEGRSAPSASGGIEDVPELVDRVLPSVVAILVETPQGSGNGSGVIWSEQGTIVTNHHVVDGATSVEVAFATGERVGGTVRASDPDTDLAVVEVDRRGLPAATFADSLPDVGSLAVAMGSPLGFQNSVSAGIISGLHRVLPPSQGDTSLKTDLIQTDAAISPGNSGGALVGATGEVVGINEAYIPPSAGAVAIGFAIPAPVVRDTVEELIQDGEASHAFLGVQPGALTPQLADEFGIDANGGVVVLEVIGGSAAEAAGLEPGDVVTRIDGTELRRVEDLYAVLRNSDPGDTVSVEVIRDGETQELEVTFAERPEP